MARCEVAILTSAVGTGKRGKSALVIDEHNFARLPSPILIAGFGSAGRRHFRNLCHLGCNKFIFLRSGHGVLEDQEISGYPSARSLEEVLSYGPKAVIIATPTAMHLEIALAAAEFGCDLYIEKPLGHDLKQAHRLARAVRERRLVAMVGCQFRFHPLFIALEQMVACGQLGRIAGATTEWGEYLPSWHPWEDYRKSYSARHELGGGAILTLIHPLDYLYRLFGNWRRVHAMVSRVHSLGTPAGEDWADIGIAFSNGVLARAHVDYLQRPPVHCLSVVGDEGRVVCDFQAGELRWWPAGRDAVIHRVPAAFDRNMMFFDAMRHFLSCVSDRSEPRVTLSDGISVLELALEARRAAASETSHA